MHRLEAEIVPIYEFSQIDTYEEKKTEDGKPKRPSPVTPSKPEEKNKMGNEMIFKTVQQLQMQPPKIVTNKKSDNEQNKVLAKMQTERYAEKKK